MNGSTNVVYPYGEILFSHKKELIYNMDEPWNYDAK